LIAANRQAIFITKGREIKKDYVKVHGIGGTEASEYFK
jgi:hypothetical protein